MFDNIPRPAAAASSSSSLPASVHHNFDIYTLPLSLPADTHHKSHELRRLTDGKSLNFDGHFYSPDNANGDHHEDEASPHVSSPIHLAYISEADGASSINMDTIFDGRGERGLERVQRRLVFNGVGVSRGELLSKPSVVKNTVIYASTHPDPGQKSSAVYLTDLTTGSTRRLTPDGHTDFSPAVSPSGLWTAVASHGEGRRWGHEVEGEDVHTDIYVFLTRDGSERVRLVERGGWPSWADESTLYFHRKSDDGWWSVYKATFPETASARENASVEAVRITPPGLHAYTPAAVNQTSVAVTTRRAGSEFRHIELFNVESDQFTELTRLVSPEAHHINPFVSPDGKRVGYQRFRGEREESEKDGSRLFLENLNCPSDQFSVRGSWFPPYSPEGGFGKFPEWKGSFVYLGANLLWDTPLEPGKAFGSPWGPNKDAGMGMRPTDSSSQRVRSPPRTKFHVTEKSHEEMFKRKH